MTRPASGGDCRRIGFVDYRLDNFHADIFLKSIRALESERGFTIGGAFALESEPSVAWAAENGVEYFAQLSALDAKVDSYMILAPSNPEVHLDLCKQVFPFGKTTYVDKTFAPDLRTAQEIFALADRCHVAIQTSSAMRYTRIQSAIAHDAAAVRDLTVWGGGTSMAEYGIHALELAVSCLGPQATQMAVFGIADHPVIALQYNRGRTATIHFNAVAHVPFRAAISTDTATQLIAVDDATLFISATSAVLDFFEAGNAQIDRQESLLIRRILDNINNKLAQETVVSLTAKPEETGVPAPKGLDLRTAPRASVRP